MLLMFVFFSLCCCRLTGVSGESVSVTEGDSVQLQINATDLQKDDYIMWKFGSEKTLIAKINIGKQIFSTFDVPDGRFRDRLKLDKHTGSLTITNITTEHTGEYKVEKNGIKRTSKIFNVYIYARLPVPVISRDCFSSSSSSSCSVVCSVVNVSHVTLSWLKGNSLLSSISVSDLSISLSLPLEVEDQDTNNYSCVLNNSITHQTTHLDTSGVCLTCPDPPPAFISLIMLISAVVVVGSLVIFAAVGIFWIYRKHRKTEQEVQIHEDITYAEPMFYRRKVQKSKVKEEDDVVYAPVASRR